MDGILNIDKPGGITSMEIVRRMKRAAGQRRVGHGGTLDPIATGVVPVFFGQATRVMEYVVDGAKEYRGVVELGVTTDTYDSEGKVVATSDPLRVTAADIETALSDFRGTIKQVPPMYSAIKQKGRRLYDLARAGLEVERAPRTVEVHRLVLEDWTPPMATVLVRCGRGFYMRSLAHDIGQKLGTGGYLKSLRRLRSGQFALESAVVLEEAEQRFEDGTIDLLMMAPDAALRSLRAVIVGKQSEEMIANGRPLPGGPRMPRSKPDDRCRAYSVDGRFLAVMVFDAGIGQWRPQKVFSLPDPDSGAPIE